MMSVLHVVLTELLCGRVTVHGIVLSDAAIDGLADGRGVLQ
jgi:hypothetical protein